MEFGNNESVLRIIDYNNTGIYLHPSTIALLLLLTHFNRTQWLIVNIFKRKSYIPTTLLNITHQKKDWDKLEVSLTTHNHNAPF